MTHTPLRPATPMLGRRAVNALRRRCGRFRQHLRDLSARRLPPWPEPAAPAAATGERPLDRIEVDTVGELRRRLNDPAAQRTATRLEVVVRRWRPPLPGWSGRLGPLKDVVRHEVCLPTAAVAQGGGGRASVTVTVAAPVPVARLGAAALAGLAPIASAVGPASAEVSLEPPVPVEPGSVEEIVRPQDAHQSRDPAGVIGPAGRRTVLVDAMTANPRGRRLYGTTLTAGQLGVVDRAGEAWWRVTRASNPSVLLVTGRVGDALDERQAETLGRIGHVSADALDLIGPSATSLPGAPGPAALAAALATLAATGVVLHAPALPADVAGLLGSDVVDILASAPPGADADGLDWEIRSVRQRRAALRRHGAAFAWPRSVGDAYPSLCRPPLVSALLVTRRPHLLATALAGLAVQTYPELEIVVGLHGIDPAPAERERLAGLHPAVVLVDVPPQWTFGEALGEVTRRARGSLLSKVDDDDRYGPEHVWDLVLARDYAGATVAGKGAEFVYLRPRDLTVRRRMTTEVYADIVAGGAMLISRGDLEAVGGWRPMDRSVDRGLLDRVLRDGGLIYRTHGLGFVYTRHGDGHTWDPGLDYFVRDAARRWDGQLQHEEFGA